MQMYIDILILSKIANVETCLHLAKNILNGLILIGFRFRFYYCFLTVAPHHHRPGADRQV